MINSEFLNGLEVPEAIELISGKIEAMGLGKKQINFKMRDANYSRQRYWGEPFPIVYNLDGVPQTLPLEELPLILPELDDFKPSANGKAPLSKLSSWVNLSNGFTRETDTMPGFAGSSWYFLRYMDPGNERELASPSAIEYWKDVDLYVGGTEHAVGHLLYSRFWHKFLYDLGYTFTPEPYKRLLNQGKIQGISESVFLQKEKENGSYVFVSKPLKQEDSEFITLHVPIEYIKDYGSTMPYLDKSGISQFLDFMPDYREALFRTEQGDFTSKELPADSKFYTHSELAKMSKSLYNVINPDAVVAEYGADCFRLFEMFLGPLEQSKPWDTRSIDGVGKFVRRFWSLFVQDSGIHCSAEQASAEELKILHKCIKRVTEDLERFSFNTCVSQFMITSNELKGLSCNKKEILEPLLRLLAPFAPFLTEELWHMMGNHQSIPLAGFPVVDNQYLIERIITYPICINGKKRGTADYPADADVPALEALTLNLDFVQKWLDGSVPKKVVVVPGKMINLVL